MKILLAIIIFICSLTAGKSQYMCPPDSLRYYEGKVITVCSDVTGTFVTKSENKTTFINFGDFPQQLFTVVIFEEDLKNFSYDPSEFLKGKNICVTGDVRMYDSGPEIIVEAEEQIRIP
jgi:endonuclease G